MTLQQFGLTPDQILRRRDGIGGSDANIIMSGDQAALIRLWEVKTGQAEPEDLSDALPVQMGNATEDFNRYWFTKQTGAAITRAGEHVISETHPFMRCNLDGVVMVPPPPLTSAAYIDCKHVNQFSKIETVTQKYMPQVHHNGHVLGLSNAILSVFIGTMNYEWVPIELDPFFTANLIEAEAYFWDCVTTMTPPGEIKIEAAPSPPALLRTVDMTGRNEWASLADDWTRHKAAAGHFETATKGLKSLIEFDVGEAFGHGVRVSRAKNGALTVREQKQ